MRKFKNIFCLLVLVLFCINIKLECKKVILYKFEEECFVTLKASIQMII